MKSPLDYISTVFISGTVFIYLFNWGRTWIEFKRDERKILKFFSSPSQYEFRSVNAIASNVGLSDARVREVCGKSSAFKRNENAKETFKLSK